MSETDLVRVILGALKMKGAWAWRANSGALVIGTGKARRFVKQGEPGTPDILGVLTQEHCLVHPRVGVLFGLEVKTAKGKQSESQRAWQVKAEKHGVLYAVVRSVSDALGAVGLAPRKDQGTVVRIEAAGRGRERDVRS